MSDVTAGTTVTQLQNFNTMKTIGFGGGSWGSKWQHSVIKDKVGIAKQKCKLEWSDPCRALALDN